MKDERAGKRSKGGGGISGGRGSRMGGRSAAAGRMPSRSIDSEKKEIWFEVVIDR